MEDRSDNRGPQIIGINVTFFFLSWLTVGLRCYVRTFMVKGFGLDDWIMVVTLILYTCYLSSQLGGVAHGTGQHREALTDHNAQIALRFWWYCEVFYTLSTCMLKIAIGFFLLRITIVKLHVWIIRTIMIVSVFLGIAYTSLVIFQCKPVSFWWDLNPEHTGKCLSAGLVMYMTYAVSALNAFADWTFGLLPIFIVKDLQMPLRVKVVVAGVIALAAIGSTATIIRLPYTATLKGYKGDLLYRTADFAIWSTVEVGVGITAGCIATLKPLMKSTFSSFYPSSSRSRNSRMPWSKGAKGSKLGHSRGESRMGVGIAGQPLDDLKPTVGTKSVTTVTVTGGKSRESSESDEEIFLPGMALPTGRGRGGINKNVTTTVTEERAASRGAGRILNEGGPSQLRSGDRYRNGSPGGDSESTLGELEERHGGKPVKGYERF